MNPSQPPRLAVWVLKHFGPETNLEALTGDLQEGFNHGKPEAWYWRQVLAAIHWRKHLGMLLLAGAVGWVWSWPALYHKSPAISRPLDMAIFTAALLFIYYLPGMLRARHRAVVVMVTVLFLGWLYQSKELADHYSILALLFISNLLFYRKRVPRKLAVREVILGDPDAERERLIENLHWALLQETDSQVRTAYEEAITTMKSKQKGDSIEPI